MKHLRVKKAYRYIAAVLSAMLVLSLSVACGSTSDEISITSKWKLEEYTVNGNTTRVADEGFLEKVLFSSSDPKFVCKDGVNCTFSLNKVDHKGTITDNDGIYVIDFSDTYKNLFARIDGDKLIMINEAGTVKFVFSVN